MKFNFLFLLVPTALISGWLLLRNIQGRSEVSFFGTADAEPKILLFNQDVWIDKVMVSIGSNVKAGDTLVSGGIYKDPRRNVEYSLEMERYRILYENQKKIYEEESELLKSKYLVDKSELEAEINTLKQLDTGHLNVRQIVFGKGAIKTEEQLKIAELESKISHLKKLHEDQMEELNTRHLNRLNVLNVDRNKDTKLNEFDNQNNAKICLIAPFDGYIDQVNINPNEPIQAYKDVLRIIPLKPIKVRGFIHESSNIQIDQGDSVVISSATQNEKLNHGIVQSISPKMVELPLRLRKFVEVRAWGREVSISLPQNNNFIIDEKLNITVLHHAQ